VLDIYEVIGLGGVLIVLVAYFLLNSGRLTQYHVSFQLLNIVGASMILCSLIEYWNLATFCIEIAWISISSVGLIKIYRRRHLSKK
tara:strand:- start:621 stop:878 length:258 start_codon:yes stop_codon:yes gene_type:complete